MLTALVLLVAVCGWLAVYLPRHGTQSGHLTSGKARNSLTRISPELAVEAKARTAAIAWIFQQVSRSAIVSCDPLVCTDLVGIGFPAGNVLTLGSTSGDPEGSDLVVATAAIRSQFGGRLTSVYAPAIIASFGSGNARIDILLVFPGGTARYHAEWAAKLAGRQVADRLLLANSRITVSPTARAQLLSGSIDPRLPSLLAAMAAIQPVSIVTFVNQSPGGGPASLLRSVDLAAVDPSAHLSPTAYVGWMHGFIDVQRAQYLPTWAQQITLPTGQSVLRIGYSAPSQLS